MRRPIPPLRSRRTRILLLLASYPDAVEASNDGGVGDNAASRLLSRNLELWYGGSYSQLEDCLGDLQRIAPHFHFATWQRFVRGKPGGARRQEMSEWGLRYLLAAMPETVWVPADISEAAGYLAGEAAAYQRPRRVAA